MAALAAVLLAALLASPVALSPTALPPGAARAVAPSRALSSAAARAVCTITDARLTEISGMAQTSAGLVVINDGDSTTNEIMIYHLDNRCRATVTSYPRDPYDTEDLAIAPDGALWVADIGDNDAVRETVALWRIPTSGHQVVRYRFTYPDGAHDAEALLFDSDGTPLILTKQFAVAGVYRPSGPLRAESGAGVRLTKVGEFLTHAIGTENPFGLFGEAVVTGAAQSPDRTKVVVRTYSDAYEFDVSGGDVVAALTRGQPRITPLPQEPQGEAIAYTPDGSAFLTLSEKPAGGKNPVLLRYSPVAAATPTAATPTGAEPTGGSAAGSPTAADSAWRVMSTWGPLAAALGAAGVLLMAGGLIGVRRSRRRR